MDYLKKISIEDFDLDTKFMVDEEMQNINGGDAANLISKGTGTVKYTQTSTFYCKAAGYIAEFACNTSTGWIDPTNNSEACKTSWTR